MKKPPRPTWGDAFGLSSLKDELARRRQAATEHAGAVEDAEREKASALAEEAKKAAALESARIAQLVEAARRRDAALAEEAKKAAALESARIAQLVEAYRRSKLHEYINERGVTHLLHFTRMSNLQSVLTHGLLPRSWLEERNISYVANDELRLDGIDGLCLSIQFPNYKLFYKLRCQNPQDHWVVVMLSTEVVGRKGCVFNSTNAAKSEMTKFSAEQRAGKDALEAMFSDAKLDSGGANDGVQRMLRSYLDLPSNYTTNPQAEIVVVEPIEPSLVRGVLFDLPRTLGNVQFLDRLALEYGPLWAGKFYPGAEAFRPRSDYRHWSSTNG